MRSVRARPNAGGCVRVAYMCRRRGVGYLAGGSDLVSIRDVIRTPVVCCLKPARSLICQFRHFPLIHHGAMDHPACAESNDWINPASNAHSILKEEHHEVRPHTQSHTSSFVQCPPVNLPVTYRDLMHWVQRMQWSISEIEGTTAPQTVVGGETVAGETAHRAAMQALKAQAQPKKELLDAIIQSMCQMLSNKNVGELCSRYNGNVIPFVSV